MKTTGLICWGLCLAVLTRLPAADLKISGTVVELPPMVVTGETGPVWHHAAMPGYEILSCCPDFMTSEFMHGLSRAEALLRLIVPAEYWAQSDVPQVIILSNPEDLALMPRELLEGDEGDRSFIYGGERLTRDSSRIVPNLELADRDCSMVFATLDPMTFDDDRFMLHPGHVRDLLSNRRPPLPDWFVAGLMNLYAGLYRAGMEQSTTSSAFPTQTEESLTPVKPGLPLHIRRDTVSLSSRLQPDTFSIPALEWISEEETAKVTKERSGGFLGKARTHPKEAVKRFLPMQLMLTQQPQPESAEWPVWNAQATLFVRWAIDGDQPARKAAFWKFVDRTARGEAITETMFRETFGLGYDETIAALNEYLGVAIKSPLQFHLAGSSPATPGIRAATKTEITRIKEDWTHLVAGYLKTRFPEAKPLDNRHRVAIRAYEKGDHDPRLLAAIGLYECDLDHDRAAQAYLEAAVAAGVVRPRAYYELARIRYAKVRKADAGPISAAEASQAVEPLLTGFKQSPVLHESYALAARIWLNSQGPVIPGSLQLLVRGTELFPDDMDLLYKVALLNDRQGYKAETRRLAALGAQKCLDPDIRAEFEALCSK